MSSLEKKDEDVFLYSTFINPGIGILPVASEQSVIHDHLDGRGFPWLTPLDGENGFTEVLRIVLD